MSTTLILKIKNNLHSISIYFKSKSSFRLFYVVSRLKSHIRMFNYLYENIEEFGSDSKNVSSLLKLNSLLNQIFAHTSFFSRKKVSELDFEKLLSEAEELMSFFEHLEEETHFLKNAVMVSYSLPPLKDMILIPENHGFGYHIHIAFKVRNGFDRSNLVITRSSDLYYIYYHAEGKAPMKFNHISKKFLKEIKKEILRNKTKLNFDSWVKRPNDSCCEFQLH